MEPINLDEETTILLRQLREYLKARRWHPNKIAGRLRQLADLFEHERKSEMERRVELKRQAVAEAEQIIRKPEQE